MPIDPRNDSSHQDKLDWLTADPEHLAYAIRYWAFQHQEIVAVMTLMLRDKDFGNAEILAEELIEQLADAVPPLTAWPFDRRSDP